jgi:DNA end-binding protein Ku
VRSIEIELFVENNRDAQELRFVKQAYYLEPHAIGRKAFYQLKSVLADEGLSAISKIVLKDREALAAIDPYSNTMLLSTLYWPDEVRSTAELDLPAEDYDFKPAEKQMALQLVQAMTGQFDAESYKDEYRAALMAVIESKIAGQPVEAPRVVETPTKIADLMSVLEASVAAARDAKAARDASAAGASDRAVDEPAAAAKTAKPKTERKRKVA